MQIFSFLTFKTKQITNYKRHDSKVKNFNLRILARENQLISILN